MTPKIFIFGLQASNRTNGNAMVASKNKRKTPFLNNFRYSIRKCTSCLDDFFKFFRFVVFTIFIVRQHLLGYSLRPVT